LEGTVIFNQQASGLLTVFIILLFPIPFVIYAFIKKKKVKNPMEQGKETMGIPPGCFAVLAITGSIIFAAIVWAASYKDYYYQIQHSGEKISFVYYYPHRVKTINISDVKEIKGITHRSRHGYTSRIVVETNKGDMKFTSADMGTDPEKTNEITLNIRKKIDEFLDR